MSDPVPPEPVALPTLGDAPPSSAGRSSAHVHEAPVEQPVISDELKARLDKVIYSEIGITTLLARLKQSVASAKEFSTFLKKRGALEDEHAQGLRKLSKAVNDAALRTDNRQGTYSSSYKDIQRLHERMAECGLQFAVSLHQMSDDLQELSTNIERGRKQWKQTGLAAEKRVVDAESQAEKAKVKYDSFAEQYDRVRTGDKHGGKFGLKGHKSAAQHEEDLLRKVQHADADYAAKVQAAQAARQELVATHRPQAVHNLQQLIAECDSGLTLQQQKFATFNEKLLLGQGLCVSPIKTEMNGSIAPKSLAEVIRQVDNQKDLHDFILTHEGNPGAVSGPEVQYQRHPTLGGGPAASSQPSLQAKRQSSIPTAFSQQNVSSPSPQLGGSTERFQQPPYPTQGESPAPPPAPPLYPSGPPSHEPPPMATVPMSTAPMGTAPMMHPPPMDKTNLPPLKPVFGLSLDDLYARDGTAVPFLVYQCFQAIELFGLDLEGIYRLSGSANHINHMKALFDNDVMTCADDSQDSSQIDLTNPENFFHDVNSVAGLVKQFFRDLPDPLFTAQYYTQFIEAARVDDDTQRRDQLHALINSLPDAHYATLRAIILHLNKVQEHSSQNRMNAGNIAICFGPTLMGANSGGNIADAGWQVRVIETILNNTFQIFDDD
ncbi:hypothetical protein N7520_002692 [Penicillium odoratum]|uniref:uncharacterized protein n=1 Tax=Penicillium odoratum TaxID=1167516 RepID=UPI002546B4DE|nr:uncharacterized protein N7520_002692 [Penicillium odoratum]KAJ5772163.1 hypothetical protein N7520_002692 [Penicillium odoratum]